MEQTPSLTLDVLHRMTHGELATAYAAGTVPDDAIAQLAGRPQCRMLDLDFAGTGKRARLIRRISRSPTFVWKGKAFSAHSDTVGEGINRTVIGERYRFDLRIEQSVIDGAPCVLLDYDRRDNPWFIRIIRDELRMVAPGLWMGPAILNGTRLLHFACSHQ